MREELREIDKILRENGWVLSVPEVQDECAEYVKSYNKGENVIGIEITLEPLSLGCYGHYGVNCVQLVKFEVDMPYIRDDIRRMQELIFNAESELLDAEIPFRPSYGFGKAIEYNLGRNYELRDKYNLARYEVEDWYKEDTTC